MTGEDMLESLKAKGEYFFSPEKGHRSLLSPARCGHEKSTDSGALLRTWESRTILEGVEQ